MGGPDVGRCVVPFKYLFIEILGEGCSNIKENDEHQHLFQTVMLMTSSHPPRQHISSLKQRLYRRLSSIGFRSAKYNCLGVAIN